MTRELATFHAHVLHQVTLWQINEIGLQQAVDELRGKAVRYGLVARYGVTEVEWIIGSEFEAAGVHYGDIRPLEDVYP
jgi:hypothetical protein